MAKSIEEKVEDTAKDWLKKLQIKYYTKTEKINAEIEQALKDAPSKSGGKYPYVVRTSQNNGIRGYIS